MVHGRPFRGYEWTPGIRGAGTPWWIQFFGRSFTAELGCVEVLLLELLMVGEGMTCGFLERLGQQEL